MGENVNHPSHYNIPGKKECIEEMKDRYGRLIVFGFDSGNAYKYQYRAGEKKDNSYLQDMSKAAWYVDHSMTVMDSWNWFQFLVFKFACWVCR